MTALLVMGISVDRTYTGCTCATGPIHVCGMYRHTPRTWKFFTLYGQSALKSRPMKRSAGTYLPWPDTLPFSRIRFLRPPTYDHTHRKPPWTIIKKIEGERSLLIRLANCDTSPSNPSAILDPIIFQEKPHRPPPYSLSPHPSDFRISLSSRDPRDLPLFLPGQWNMDICVAIRTGGWRARVAGGFPLRRKSEILSLQWPFVFLLWNPRNGFCDVESASMPGFSRRVEVSYTRVRMSPLHLARM